MKSKHQPVSDRRLRVAALAWAKAKLREAESYLSDSPGECTQRLKERRAAETELLRLCVKMLAEKGKA